MKSPILRSSRGSRNASGSNAPSPSRGMTLAILHGRSSTSKLSMRLAPLLPASKAFQLCSTPKPSGERSPMPVTTTRLISESCLRAEAPRSGRGLLDILHRVPDRQDRLGRIVGDFDAELFLEGHDQLNGVEAV